MKDDSEMSQNKPNFSLRMFGTVRSLLLVYVVICKVEPKFPSVPFNKYLLYLAIADLSLTLSTVSFTFYQHQVSTSYYNNILVSTTRLASKGISFANLLQTTLPPSGLVVFLYLFLLLSASED